MQTVSMSTPCFNSLPLFPCRMEVLWCLHSRGDVEREQQPQEETARLGQARIWDEVVSTIPTLAIEERLAARSLILEPAASSLLAPGSLLKTESCPPPHQPQVYWIRLCIFKRSPKWFISLECPGYTAFENVKESARLPIKLQWGSLDILHFLKMRIWN